MGIGGKAKDWAKLRIKGLLQDEDLWFKKVIPPGVRHVFSRPLERWVVPKPQRLEIPEPYDPGRFPPGVNLYGLFRAEIGLSQGVKLYEKAMQAGGIPHGLLNLDFMPGLPQNDCSYDGRLTKANRYAVNVVHINPPEWPNACGIFPQRDFDRHYNIGVFLWELETVPAEWIPNLAYVDEIWAPSGFIANAFRKVTDKPVTVIPYGIEAPWDETLAREDFGLSGDDFLVLMMFDSNSFASRKNPGAAIDAFREAYGDRPERVKLVVKINNPRPEDISFVEEHLGDAAEYVMITERMEKPRLNSLIRLCDVFVSLHRAEGFGLVMAEAMMLGTPAVATNWSANTEFMTEESACMVGYTPVPVAGAYQHDDGTMVWAEPDVHQAAAYLKRLREDPAYYREKAEAGRRYVTECLSMEKCAEKMNHRLREILGGEQRWTSRR